MSLYFCSFHVHVQCSIHVVVPLYLHIQILPYINGFNHVKKIAEESEVDNEIVKVCIQHLM